MRFPGFISVGPTEINASGGSQPRKEEGASHHARRGKNAEAFLNFRKATSDLCIDQYYLLKTGNFALKKHDSLLLFFAILLYNKAKREV